MHTDDLDRDGRPNGAFTHAALATVQAGWSWAAWQQRTRGRLRSRDFPQAPQLGGSWTQRRWTALDQTRQACCGPVGHPWHADHLMTAPVPPSG
jgi:hypothetical protein